jgi:lactate permease
MWSQGYDPLGNAVLSTLLAGTPVIVLLGTIGWLRWKAHHAALLGLATALVIAMFAFRLPPSMAVSAALYGAAYGFFPIGWIVLNALFLYQFSNDTGSFKVLRDSLSAVTPDRRLQVLLVAFSFGAFMEGGAGFSAPVAVSAAMLIGLGFSPLAASGVALVANTVCVPFGSLGVPEVTLAAVSGRDLLQLTIATGWLLVPFCIIVPFWTVGVFSGTKGMMTIWPAALVAGVSYAIPHQLVALYQGPWLVSVIASVVSLGTLVAFLRVWKPKEAWTATGAGGTGELEVTRHAPRAILRAWTPWIILTLTLLMWGVPRVAGFLGGLTTVATQVPTLHNLVQRVPPAVAVARLEAAVFNLNWLTATGTAILVATLISSLVMGFPLRSLAGTYLRTIKTVRFALLTISTMVAIGFTTRYAGMDATLGLAFAGTGALYPFFGTLVGYLGVASTGSIASSNALFGSQQVITAENLGLNPNIMASANAAGGSMAKMVSAQSIVVASTATNWHGHESDILRHLFLHSLALVCLVGLWVMAMAYIPGLAALAPRP